MKKFRLVDISKIIYVLLVIGGIITFWVVFKEIDNKFAAKFVVGYMIFLVFSVLYMIIMTVVKMRKLKKDEMKRRSIRFIILFIVLGILRCCFDYFIEKEEINLFESLLNAFMFSFSMSFFDLMFLRKSES